MAKKSSNTNFLLQGSILAFSGILVRIIGLIYRIPLNNILDATAMGYYAIAYDIYSILLLLSSQSMPIAVSKLVSAKLAKSEKRNAYKVFKGALIYAIVVGTIFGSAAFLGADFLAGVVYKSSGSASALRVLAPTIVVVSIIGVFRGYFQGMGNIVPTAISQVLEQIVNAIVSVSAAYYLFQYGLTLSHATEAEQLNHGRMLGAAGGTLGTCLGAVTAFIVLMIIFVRQKKAITEGFQTDRSSDTESYGVISKAIILTITPILISTTIYQIGNLIDNAIYGNVMVDFFGMSERVRTDFWSVYSNKYKLLTTMPIAIASSLTLSIVPAIVNSYTLKDMDAVKEKIAMAIRFTMIIAFPCGVGLSVLGGPINVLLFPASGYVELSTKIMILSVFTVAAFCLSTITNSILQGIDKLKTPIYNSGVSLAAHLVIIFVLLLVFQLDIYGVVIGDFTFAMMVCILNARSIKKYIGYRQEIRNTFVKPLISSVFMGIIAYAVFYFVKLLIKYVGAGIIISNDLAVLVAIIVAIPVYFVILIKIKGMDEEIMLCFPKGTMLIRLCKKVHLL